MDASPNTLAKRKSRLKPEIRAKEKAYAKKSYAENPKRVMHWYRSSPQSWLKGALIRARSRAKRFGLTFDLDFNDLELPTHCPVLGLELDYAGKQAGHLRAAPRSPSLDRFNNDFGYVAGNVRVISSRANMLKSNGALAEFRAIVRYMEGG